MVERKMEREKSFRSKVSRGEARKVGTVDLADVPADDRLLICPLTQLQLQCTH